MTILSPQQLLELEAIFTTSDGKIIDFATFKADYISHVSVNNVAETYAAKYYRTLANDGIAYGNLAYGVVTNNTAEGQVTNAYVNTYGVDMSVGSDVWLTAMWNIMQDDWKARNAKSRTDLTWQDYYQFHATAFHDTDPRLNPETWTLYIPLTQIAITDPAAANTLWNNISTSPESKGSE